MFEIIYNSAKGGHADICISIADINFSTEVDSYYLRIDHLFMPEDESSEKVKKCLELMVSGWITTIERIAVNQTTYLPYDFSDQYVGVFRIHKKLSDKMSIRPGFTTKYSGWEICPSSDTFLNLNDNEFESAGDECLFFKDVLVHQLANAFRVL